MVHAPDWAEETFPYNYSFRMLKDVLTLDICTESREPVFPRFLMPPLTLLLPKQHGGRHPIQIQTRDNRWICEELGSGGGVWM